MDSRWLPEPSQRRLGARHSSSLRAPYSTAPFPAAMLRSQESVRQGR